MAKLSNYNGSVELLAGIKQAGNGAFALVEANAVQVDESGKRLDEVLAGLAPANHTHTGYASVGHTHAGYASAGHTHHHVKEVLQSNYLTANTHYYLKGAKTLIVLYFPTSASVDDRIFVQFVSGSGISATISNAYFCNSGTWQPNSIIELHAVYGIVSADSYGWNVVVHQRKLGD